MPREGAIKLDATIGGYAHDAGRSIIVVINKWDLIARDTHTAVRLEKEFRLRMRFLHYAPMIFVSAKSGQRVAKILELVSEAYRARRIRVPTAELNIFLGAGDSTYIDVGQFAKVPGQVCCPGLRHSSHLCFLYPRFQEVAFFNPAIRREPSARKSMASMLPRFGFCIGEAGRSREECEVRRHDCTSSKHPRLHSAPQVSPTLRRGWFNRPQGLSQGSSAGG